MICRLCYPAKLDIPDVITVKLVKISSLLALLRRLGCIAFDEKFNFELAANLGEGTAYQVIRQLVCSVSLHSQNAFMRPDPEINVLALERNSSERQ